MSETLLNEIRATKPEAPSALRERVRALSVQEPAREPFLDRFRFNWGWRRLVLAVPATVVVALVAAGVIGLSRDGNRATSAGSAAELQTFSAATSQTEAATPPAARSAAPAAKDAATGSTIAPAPGQLQRFEAELGLRVDDVDALSDATKQAQQIAHDHGGTVSSLQYDAPSAGVGTAQITLRIPTAQVEDALAELSQLGTIVGQRYGIQDLQQQADSLQTQIEQTQRRIAQILTQLESATLSNENRVVLQSRLNAARLKLTGLRESLRSTRAEAAHRDRQRHPHDRGDRGSSGRRRPPRRDQGRARLGGGRAPLRARRRRPVRDRRVPRLARPAPAAAPRDLPPARAELALDGHRELGTHGRAVTLLARHT